MTLLHEAGNIKFGHTALAVVTLLMLGGCGKPVTVGLKPEYPKAWDWCTKVPFRQPTLRWQTLVADHLKKSKAEVTDITYELKIWLPDHDAAGKLVYAREGLPEASHTVQEPLSVAATYFWSVRARFLLNGAPRTTDWGQQLRMKVRVADIDHEYYQYYCFFIPREEQTFDR